jgi:ribonuclease VapC
MVIDSSALIAMLRNEPEAAAFERAIFRASVRLLSTVTKLESGMVAAGRRGAAGAADLDRLLSWIAATIVPFDERQADIARDAFVRYGKGRHKAGLNFGDCAAYALAIAEAEPLLFKGTDFAATDVDCVPLGAAEDG